MLSFCTLVFISGSNLGGLHRRYNGVLQVLRKLSGSLSQAMKEYGVARNTVKDFLGLCELKIIDIKRYQTVVKMELEMSGKSSVHAIVVLPVCVTG